MKAYVLIKDFNWFGKTIQSGTIYRQHNSTKDKFRCFMPNGNECPHWDLTFMTVKNNSEYFIELTEKSISSAFLN